MKKNIPSIIAFYSYKGGVGRSLSLANTGVELALRGKKVLLIDFDLEAPGLHEIDPFRTVSSPASGGVVELLKRYIREAKEASSFAQWKLEEYATPVWPNVNTDNETKDEIEEESEPPEGEVWLIPASGALWLSASSATDANRVEATYADALADFDWNHFYQAGGDAAWAHMLNRFQDYGFDVVLLDSRTGLSDPFYVALTLASQLVMVTGLNRQNIKGVRDVLKQIQSTESIAQFGAKRLHLVGSPIPELDAERWTRWENELRLPEYWPDFPGFVARLPYFKEFALNEVVVMHQAVDASTPIQAFEYQRQIKLLAAKFSELPDEAVPQALTTPPAITPTNPFALLRADYVSIDELGDYFIDPGQELKRAMEATFKPVIMAGARGCGKTMLGRYFGYERAARDLSKHGVQPSPVSAPEYLGLYLRIDIDLLQIFNPPKEELRHSYDQLFGQFFDFLVFRKALDALEAFGGFQAWAGSEAAAQDICQTLLAEFGATGANTAPTVQGMQSLIKGVMSSMRRYINNPRQEPEPYKLQSNILLKLLVEELLNKNADAFRQRYFSVVVDEYEHFSDVQQMVVNSRIKQIKQSDHVTYRIFVKHGKAGLHTTATLSQGQQIQPIHDFNLINLDEDVPPQEFARQQHRIAERYLQLNPYFKSLGVDTLDDLLESETAAEQARRIASTDNKLREHVLKHFAADAPMIFEWFDAEPRMLTKAVAVVIMNQGRRLRTRTAQSVYRQAEGKSPQGVIKEFKAKSAKAKDWLHNYERGTLFWLSRLYARPQHISYAGSDMVITLAGRNVRTFLEMCRAIVEEWFAKRPEHGPYEKPLISPHIQTLALKSASEGYRGVIRSLPKHSQELLSLTDRLGRMFSALAKTSTQSEPEINHFSLGGNPTGEDWYEFFETAYAESILLRLKGNKQKSDIDIQQDDWQLNPCFAPHYGFSPRRKKKLGELNPEQMKALFAKEEGESQELQRRLTTKFEDMVLDTPQQDIFE